MQTVLTWVGRAIMTWLGWREAVRRASERLTLRLSGWKLVIWLVLVLAVYLYTWRGAYLWTLDLIRQIPLPVLEYGLAGLVTVGWMTWPLVRLVWRVLRARQVKEGTVKLFLLMVFDRHGQVVKTYQTFAEPDAAVEQEAITGAIAAAEVTGEITAPGDYWVSVKTCEITSREFSRALRLQKLNQTIK